MNKQQKIVIIDFGTGNLFNLQRAFNHVGVQVNISGNIDEVAKADKVVLPGVGAFAKGMSNLRKANLHEALALHHYKQKPILGICLGMQLLMETSEEHGKNEGLGFIMGDVVKFRPPAPNEETFKIPQAAWNEINPSTNINEAWSNSILSGLKRGSYMYFLHSYVVKLKNIQDGLAMTHYGRDTFCSALLHENVTGCQFHPELSGQAGLKIIENFSAL